MPTVLHVLDHSFPLQSGYATRSHSIITALARCGVSVGAVTSPKHGESSGEKEVIDNVTYYRSAPIHAAPTTGVLGQVRSIRYTSRTLRSVCATLKPDIIHAHSPCLNGLATLGIGLPLVYEIRSSWEDAAVSEGLTANGSARYRLSKFLETFVAKRADEIVVICDGLRKEFESRGICPSKVSVVPNAIQDEMLVNPTDAQISSVREAHGLAGCKVIGYFGSFFRWEGVEDLIRAMPAILEHVPRAKLLLVGGGREERNLRHLADNLNLDAHTVFVGRLPHERIADYYGVADVMVYPRLSNALTEMVTPLKPLEAMAQCKPVVASGIGGHKELVEDTVTGYLYESGDHNQLVDRVVDVLNGGADMRGLVARARNFVEREKRWPFVADRYLSIYDRILERNS